MDTFIFRRACEIAKASNLFDAEGQALSERLLDMGLVWHEDLASSIRQTIAHHRKELAGNAYALHLARGTRPAKARRADWAAKDAYFALLQAIEKYVALEGQLTGRASESLRATLDFVCLTASIEEDLCATATETYRVQPLLSAQDFELCLTWVGLASSQSNSACMEDLRDRLGNFEADRLSSARSAEIAALEYYRDIGFDVSDVSIQQLRRNTVDWKDYDLLVNGDPVDVKNARRSFSSPDSYVEHAVPAFKLSRHSGKEVAIAGVLSDYALSLDAEGNLGRFVRILGEVRLSYLRRLFVWMRTRFGKILSLERMWRPDFQPGWAFEYRQEHYRSRSAAIDRIPDLLRQAGAVRLKQDAVCGWLFTLCPDPKATSAYHVSDEQQRVVHDLRDLATGVGLGRPSLYLYCMGVLLEKIAAREDIAKTEAALHRALYGTASRELSARPLGLEDPQKYVNRIIGALSIVSKAVMSGELSFSTFKLTHPEILRGQTTEGTWLTLLAYCGGWRQEPRVAKCGSSPLILGQNSHCPACGHLCCLDCGFCSKTCSAVATRQASVAAEYRSRGRHD